MNICLDPSFDPNAQATTAQEWDLKTLKSLRAGGFFSIFVMSLKGDHS